MPNHLRITTIFSAALLGSAALVGCADDPEGATTPSVPPCEALYPESVGSPMVYVAPSCAGDGSDGSHDSPYGTIQEAIDASPDGATILIAPGSYPENLTVQTAGITLVGSSDGAPALEATVTLEAPDVDQAAIHVTGAMDATVQGIHVLNPGVAGIWLQDGSLTVVDSQISSAAGDSDGAFGFGVLAEEPVGIWLQRTAITGCAATGVLIHGSTGAISIHENTIDGNQRGGLRIEDHQAGGVIADNSFDGNLETGIALLSVVGIWLQNNGVHDTQPGGPTQSGDGVLITELQDADGVSYGTSEVVVGGDASAGEPPLGNQISGNSRVGLLLSGDVSGVIVGNASDTNGRAGIWLQNNAGRKDGIWLQQQADTGIWLQSHHAEAGIWLQANGAMGNSFVGISVGAGARASLMSNVITDTEAGQMIDPEGIGTISMGDGVGLFADATARVEGNSIVGNARLGVLGDGLSSDSVIAGNECAENGAGDMALQGVSSAEMPSGSDVDPERMSTGGAYSVVPEANDPNGFGSGHAVMDAPNS